MRIGVVIQARMSSQRLPGKILMPMAGRPVLEWVVHRMRASSRCSDLVVATSDREGDDPVARWCASNEVQCYRGSLDDVLGRVAEAAAFMGFDAFVRVCADSPLIDHELADRGIGLMNSAECDVVTNVHPRTFPKGQSVEVVTLAAAGKLRDEALTDDEREHVTPGFYARADEFKIISFAPEREYGSLPPVVIDTPEDFRRVEALIQEAGDEAGSRRWWEWMSAA